MMRRGSGDPGSIVFPPSSAPGGGLGSSFTGGTQPNSPIHRMESLASEFLASTQPASSHSKRTRKISLPKALGSGKRLYLRSTGGDGVGMVRGVRKSTSGIPAPDNTPVSLVSSGTMAS
ncbi:unnamed protein product, partial [Discosporangium mesarthrocarpum]